jgi:hypothetical protein
MSPRQLPVVSGKRIVRALERAGFDVVSTRNPRSATLMGMQHWRPASLGLHTGTTGHGEVKLCVLRARRVRGLATSGSGLTACRRLVSIEGLLELTLFGLGPDLDEEHHDDTGP